MNTIVGRITKNAEINTLKNDRQVVNFSVAINDSYKTTYYNCSYWISPNVAKILTKGTVVELTGKASSSAWIGKDGEIRSGLNFHTSYIQVYGGGRNVVSEPKQNATQESNNPFAGDTDDDLPF